MGISSEGQSATKGKGKGKRGHIGGYGLGTTTSEAWAERKKAPWLSDDVQDLLAQYAVPANAGVCGLLAVLELVQGRQWREGVMIGGGYLPGLVFAVVLWARRELRVVDLSELQDLRS